MTDNRYTDSGENKYGVHDEYGNKGKRTRNSSKDRSEHRSREKCKGIRKNEKENYKFAEKASDSGKVY